MKSFITISSAFFICVSLTGCLKSRIQFREDSEDQETSRPVSAQVQEVHPQGSYVLDEIKGELTRLNGRVEELERSKPDAGALQTEKEELKKLTNRIIELEQAQANLIEAFQKLKQSGPALSNDSEELFKKAKIKFGANLCDEAIEDFTEYLKSSQAKQAEDATFFRAECYFKLKQYKKAIVDYSRFPERFTRSKHMPIALFKIGGSFEAMGMKEDAKGFYQELIEKFPKTSEASRARAKLK